MDDDALTRRIITALWASLIGTLAWLARVLSAADDLPPLRRLIGGLLGAAIATFSTGTLAIEYLNADPFLIVGFAGPIGWLGGDALNSLALFMLSRFKRS